jgi:hypothetical protein
MALIGGSVAGAEATTGLQLAHAWEKCKPSPSPSDWHLASSRSLRDPSWQAKGMVPQASLVPKEQQQPPRAAAGSLGQAPRVESLALSLALCFHLPEGSESAWWLGGEPPCREKRAGGNSQRAGGKKHGPPLPNGKERAAKSASKSAGLPPCAASRLRACAVASMSGPSPQR